MSASLGDLDAASDAAASDAAASDAAAEVRAVRLAARADAHERVRALVDEYMDSVWRSLRRLGVPAADCDDGCQRVWVVVAQKIDDIDTGKVRSFVFSVVVRVASDMRRSLRRHDRVDFDERLIDCSASDTESLLEQQRARELLDELLSQLSWELRTVFVMFEIEGFSSPEIADILHLSRGTIASRLRLAREAFERVVQRYRKRSGIRETGAQRRAPLVKGC
jgi:RNA polymerase sigma-70 factor (ECF subfamily)